MLKKNRIEVKLLFDYLIDECSLLYKLLGLLWSIKLQYKLVIFLSKLGDMLDSLGGSEVLSQ